MRRRIFLAASSASLALAACAASAPAPAPLAETPIAAAEAAAGDPQPFPGVRYAPWGIDLTAIDPTVKPGDDFWGYVNGAWAATWCPSIAITCS